jgi:phasin family protein
MDRLTRHLKNPFAGLNQLLERVSLPGFDAAGIVDARRKDIDAVLEANRIVYAGAQALAQKQIEIMRTTMSAARSAVTDGTFSGSPMEIAGKQRDMMTKAFQLSLSHMRELAEIVRKAQSDAFAVVKGQVEADIRGLVGRVQGKGKAAPAAAPAAKKAPARKKPAKKPAAKKVPARKSAKKKAA